MINREASSLDDNETLKQTTINPQLIQQLKVHAASRKLLMKELYEQAIFSLIKYRMRKQEEGKTIDYVSSPKNGKELNIVMRKTLARRITQISDMDKTSVRRFLYTALKYYANEYQLDELEIHQ